MQPLIPFSSAVPYADGQNSVKVGHESCTGIA